MIHSLIQYEHFWLLLLIIVVGYYGWVVFRYFRVPITEYFQNRGLGNAQKQMKGKLKVSWDDLVIAFTIQRKLIHNPGVDLHPEERALLNQSPFREVLASELPA
ncbi:hypothetical protein [uncultured Algoriphagus sp.]|uniref:hypothetical protein n=1 Tax=uncultured Algoriphagus sp. TaxID=417365 RepID=UPI00258DB15F|nr:hypothetical protein [uncultured Algoriphagus sp.]